MPHTDPEHAHFIVEFIANYLAQILTGTAIVILAGLGRLGKVKTATAAKEILQEKPVTHFEVDAKLMKCQLEVTKGINDSFNGFREEIMKEIRLIHTRINTLGK